MMLQLPATFDYRGIGEIFQGQMQRHASIPGYF